MCVTTTSHITVSIILVVITTVIMKERRVNVVAILIFHSSVTSVGILIRHWMESAAMMAVVDFAFAIMARGRFRTVCGRKLRRVVTFS